METNLTIAMYHYVRPLNKTRYPLIKGLHSDLFKDHIHFLAKNYKFIRIEDLQEHFITKKELPKKSCLLTFDDGYKDHFDYVFPTLKAHRIQGCFYAPIKTITSNHVLDVNKIHFLLATVQDIQLLIRDIFQSITQNQNKFNLKAPNEYYQKLAHANRFDPAEIIFVKRVLQVELPTEFRIQLINELFEKYLNVSDEVFREELYLNLDQVKFMIDQGMHFGAHGNTHCWLSQLNEQDQTSELEESKKFLLSLGQKGPLSIAYPYGMYNEKTIEICRSLGFSLGFTTEFRKAQTQNENPLLLPRWDAVDVSREMNS